MVDRMNNFRVRHLLVLAYGLLVVVVTIGFLRMEALAARIEQESSLQAYANCVSTNEAKSAVIFMTKALREFARNPEDTLEESQAKDDFVQQIVNGVPLADCPPNPNP